MILMSTRSNPSAFIPALPSISYPPVNDLRQLTATGIYLSDQLSQDSWSGGSNGDTPTPQPVPNRWSDATLTTGRSSFCSWGEDEGVLDRLAGETVGRIFDSIDRALYEGCPTGQEEVDIECKEWSTNFPHFRISGVHLLDSLEDGTEIVDPIIPEDSSEETLTSTPVAIEKLTSLSISGCGLTPLPPPPLTTGSPPNDNPGLHYQEIIVTDGIVEEYFAYSTDSKEGIELKKVSQRHHSRPLPPVTPTECIRDTVISIVFDQLWSEIATVMQPLLLKYKTLESDHDVCTYSEGNLTLSHLPVLYLPTKDGQLPPPTRQGQTQSLKKKPSSTVQSSNLMGANTSFHTTDLPSLQKVMTIKPVSLQQRLPSSTLPPTNNLFSTSGTGSMIFHEALLSSRRPTSTLRNLPSSSHTPLPPPPPHRSSTNSTTTSNNNNEPKAISGKPGNRRNPLKPIDIPKTPVLPPVMMHDEDIRDFNGLVGQRLIRHSILPPLPPLDRSQPLPFQSTSINDKTNNLIFVPPPAPPPTSTMTAATGTGASSYLPKSSGVKGRVTFSNRIVSAAVENHEFGGRHNQRQQLQSVLSNTQSSDTNNRPNTTQTFRVVGHAASLHNDLTLWEEQEEGHHDNHSHFTFASPKPKSSMHSRSRLASRGGPIK